MSDNWFTHNTDKLLLYSLVVLAGVFMLHVLHHGPADKELMAWLENAFSTILGALILILTGRISRANGDVPKAPNPTGGIDAPKV